MNIDYLFIFSLVIFIYIINLARLYIIFYKGLNIIYFLIFVFFNFIILKYNSYVGFLLLVEMMATIFIITVVTNHSNYYCHYLSKYDYLILFIFYILFFIEVTYYYNFNFYEFFYNFYKNKNNFFNDFFGVFILLYSKINYYIIVIGISLLIITYLIIFFLKKFFLLKFLKIKKLLYSYYSTYFVKEDFYEKRRIWDFEFDNLWDRFK